MPTVLSVKTINRYCVSPVSSGQSLHSHAKTPESRVTCLGHLPGPAPSTHARLCCANPRHLPRSILLFR
jgi:hypothetical protein